MAGIDQVDEKGCSKSFFSSLLNPDAQVIETDRSRVHAEAIFETGLFNFEQAHTHPMWFPISVAERQAVQIAGVRSNTSDRFEGARNRELSRWLSSTIMLAAERTARLMISSSSSSEAFVFERWLCFTGLKLTGAFVVQLLKTLAGIRARDPRRR